MADRTVVYRLQADITQFRAQMAAAGASSKKLGAEMTGAGAQATKSSKGLDALGLSAGTVAAGGIAMIVKKSADFEQAMSNVQAATHESAGAMDALKQAAMDAGAETSFSATEAAAGIENLAKAGISTADILDGGLTGALNLAAAGGLGVAESAEIAATALTQFKLEGDQTTHVADLLAAGAGKAQGEVTDLGMALNQSGLVAAQMGLSIEETTGTLSAFASAGLLGSDAGTSLKTMLLRLANPSTEAAKTMERFGISAYDAQGKMLPMADVAGQLQVAFKGQSQATRDAALATIFGSDAIRAAGVLYTQGAAGIDEWTSKVNDSGFAAETAAIRMDNLKGDLEFLMGSLETGLIGAGEGSQESLRGTTQAATTLLDVLNEINSKDSVQGATATLGMGGLTPDVLEIGLNNLRKTKDAIFGVDDASKDAADSADELSDAELSAANAASQHAAAAQQSAAEIEAQAKALDDARKAARETAGSFFNLGDSVSDATVSLGDWIRQMANQADALNNFTSNAEKAANKGLRQGLIAALKEAGPEGALRMKQLANATEAEIDKANAAWSKGEKAIDRYVTATAGVPGSVSTTLFMDSKGAMAALAQARRELDALDARDVEAIMRITTVYKTVGNVGDAIAPKNRATGGAVFGPGTATSDSIPALLSNGEYVIKAAAVDRYGMGFFDRANAMRLAGGGSAETDAQKKEREKREKARSAAEERRRREEEKRQRQLDNKATKDQLSIDLSNESQQADISVMDARRRLQSAKKADRSNSEINEARLALKEARTGRRDLTERANEEARENQERFNEEQLRIAKDAEAERTRIAEEAEDARLKAEEERANAVYDGQQKAWDQLTDAGQKAVDAAQATINSVQANMDRIGDAATSQFRSGLFGGDAKQQHGLSVGDPGASGWQGALGADIAGLQERQGLIGQLSAQGITGSALEALLGQGSNADISTLLAGGQAGQYAAMFAQREALTGQVGRAAGVAGYGSDMAAAQAVMANATSQLAALTAAIEAARPITVLESVSAAATAAEIVRLMSATGVQ